MRNESTTLTVTEKLRNYNAFMSSDYLNEKEIYLELKLARFTRETGCCFCRQRDDKAILCVEVEKVKAKE